MGNVQLRRKENSNGTVSLYLDIYSRGKRRYEFLSLKLIKPARTALDRVNNQQNLQLAEQIRNNKANELAANDYQIQPKFKSKVVFLEYFDNFVNKYTKKDKRILVASYHKLIEFMRDQDKISLSINQVDGLFVSDFKEYLESHLNGESPANYFKKFKMVLKKALTEKLIHQNPASDIIISSRNDSINKEILSSEEIELLYQVPCTNDQVKKSFIFCCFTGLRYCDIKSLTWGNIDFINNRLSIVQQKTGVPLDIKLHESALQLLPKTKGIGGVQVFNLPSHNACIKGLKVWVKRAGINKKITWHCARHSLATNIIFYGGDLINSSSVLGHTTVKYTERYTRKVASLRDKAIDNLPGLSTASKLIETV